MKDISTSENTSSNNIIIGNLETNKINDVKGTDTSNSNSNSKLSHATNNLIVGDRNTLTGNSTIVVGLSNTVTGENYGGGNGNLQVYGYSNTVKGASSQVFGQGNKAYGVYNTVSGYENEVGKSSDRISDNRYNVVSGYKNKVEGEHNIVFGEDNEAKKADDTAVDYTVALGYSVKTLGNDAVAIGKQTEANIGSTAIGKTAKATGNYSTALGKESKALGSYTVAIGDNAKASKSSAVAIGSDAKAEHSSSVALGSEAITTRSDEVSVGKAGSEKFIANVKDAVKDTDAVNKKQMDDGDKATLVSAKLFTAGKIVSEALKREAGDAKTLADAKQYTDEKFSPLNTKVTNLENKITATEDKITQVEDKVTDVETKVVGVDSKIVQAKNEVVSQIMEEAVKREAGDTQTLQTANQYTDLKLGTLQTQVHNFQSDFNELNGKLGKLDGKLERGLAAANALSGLVLPQVVGKASFSAAVGGYGSRNAVAIGVGYTPKANITLKSGIAVNAGKNSKISYQMGAGWVW